MKNKKVGFILISFIISGWTFTSAYAQSKSNLEVFNNMVDSSAVMINQNISPAGDSISLKFNSGDFFSVFQNRLVLDFSKLGKTVSNSSGNIINYTIENASVNYGDMHKDGLFGDFYVPRTLKLDGNFSVENNKTVPGKFNLALTDTVAVDDISSLENPAYPFTRGEVPSEPFFSSLFAPVVAIGSAALAVILFFTVRSN